MTKLIAAALAALVLVACSDTETSDPRTTTGLEATPAGDGAPTPAAPTAAPCPEDEKKPTERKTPTTFEACEGYWSCGGYPGMWMRPSGDECLLGRVITFRADGSFVESQMKREGTWTGDAYYARLQFGPGPTEWFNCNRQPEE